MDYLSFKSLSSYWTATGVAVNVVIFMNLLGAMLLGFVLGYERTFHGRAAGMRVYGLVCMASAALIVVEGYPGFWFGGHDATVAPVYPGHAIQGIVTGIGFLGAGVIMKEGFSISGLTTAASIWASSAVGVLVGFGFYAAAILLTGLSVLSVVWVSRLEGWLPSKPAVAIRMRFRKGFNPQLDVLKRVAAERGYDVITNTLSISCHLDQTEWNYVAVMRNRKTAVTVDRLAEELTRFEGAEDFQLSLARN